MIKRKKYIRLEEVQGLPETALLRHLLGESTRARGCTVELPWRSMKTGLRYSIAVCLEIGRLEPIWSLYQGEGNSSKMIWAQTFKDPQLLSDVMSLSLPDEFKANSDIFADSRKNDRDKDWDPKFERSKHTYQGTNNSLELLSPTLPELPPKPESEGFFSQTNNLGMVNQPDRKPTVPTVQAMPAPYPLSQSQSMPASGYPEGGVYYQPANYQTPYQTAYQPPYQTAYQPPYQPPHQQINHTPYQQFPPYPTPPPHPYAQNALNQQGYPPIPAQSPNAYSSDYAPQLVPQYGYPQAPQTNRGTSIFELDLMAKRPNLLIGEFIVLTGLIPKSTVEAALELQEMVRNGFLSTTQAAEAVLKAHSRGGQIEQFSPSSVPQNADKAKVIAPPLGEILVESGLIRISILKALLNLQEVVRTGALSKEEAIESFRLEHFGKDKKAETEESSHTKNVIELFLKAKLIQSSDLDAAHSVKKKYGGDLVKILEAAGKLDKLSLEAASHCQALIDGGRFRIDQAIIVLHYCHRSRVSFDDAIDELGWEKP